MLYTAVHSEYTVLYSVTRTLLHRVTQCHGVYLGLNAFTQHRRRMGYTMLHTVTDTRAYHRIKRFYTVASEEVLWYVQTVEHITGLNGGIRRSVRKHCSCLDLAPKSGASYTWDCILFSFYWEVGMTKTGKKWPPFLCHWEISFWDIFGLFCPL